MSKLLRSFFFLSALMFTVFAQAQSTPLTTLYPTLQEGDAVLKNFKFSTGDVFPELKIHYTTLGDAKNPAVLVLHGSAGSGQTMLTDQFAGELFGPGQPLDAARYFIVLPDGIGHGKSSKPSDGLHAKFPQYGYRDMVEAQYRLLTEGLGVNHLRLVEETASII